VPRYNAAIGVEENQHRQPFKKKSEGHQHTVTVVASLHQSEGRDVGLLPQTHRKFSMQIQGLSNPNAKVKLGKAQGF
jgi:hypothetical protein